MSARDTLLRRVRDAARHEVPHPGPFRPLPGVSGWERFAETLCSVGGEPVGPVARAELGPTLVELCRSAGSGRVVAGAGVAELAGEGAWEGVPEGVPPQSLADVEIAILRGSIGVAENGAVALEGKHARVRALPFLCARLVLLLEVAAIVPDMHQATSHMPEDAMRFHHFTWISGPSKTADIEQTLVLGAHAARSLVVVGIRDP
jgi:L-lactate dehydrogenase complex protein LldG